MSLLRRDPTSYGWTIYAEEEFRSSISPCEDENREGPETCPFCEGHEFQTPPEIAAIRPSDSKPNGPGWRVRTIPDQNAVLRIEGQLERRGEGLYDMMNGIGAHEIIVETPNHYALFSEFDEQQLCDIIWMYRERMRDLLKDPRFRYIQVCRNYGIRAGARLAHPHSLVFALPVIPRAVREEIGRAAEYWQMKERCVFCDIVNQESESGGRIVFRNGDFLVLEPFAARIPFETWILPIEHQSRFQDLPDEKIVTLARALQHSARALAIELRNSPYNLIIHTSPVRLEKQFDTHQMPLADYYHWHIEIVPRLRELNGFEYGTGISVNPVLPEKAAALLRARLEENITPAKDQQQGLS
ncbi:MAG: galactose-1-phosphate uridylyltransferase [Candidatus Sumerlaeaceae bacterium]